MNTRAPLVVSATAIFSACFALPPDRQSRQLGPVIDRVIGDSAIHAGRVATGFFIEGHRLATTRAAELLAKDGSVLATLGLVTVADESLRVTLPSQALAALLAVDGPVTLVVTTGAGAARQEVQLLRGEPGPAGAPGPTGAAGAAGSPGATGATGATGQAGGQTYVAGPRISIVGSTISVNGTSNTPLVANSVTCVAPYVDIGGQASADTAASVISAGLAGRHDESGAMSCGAAAGVVGLATTTTPLQGFHYGVYGQAFSSYGAGLYGVTTEDSAAAHGVEGVATAPSGVAVRAANTAGGVGLAVQGRASLKDAALPVFYFKDVRTGANAWVTRCCTIDGAQTAVVANRTGIAIGGACSVRTGTERPTGGFADASGVAISASASPTAMEVGSCYTCFGPNGEQVHTEVVCLRAAGSFIE